LKHRSLILTVWVALAAGASGADERPHLTIPRLPRTPQMEEFLDMRGPADLTGLMAHVDTFTQREPEDGAPASQKTDVYLGYDDKNFYAVFVAFDDEPDRVRAHMARRENVFGDDIVEIQLDTYLDEQRAFSFIVNPLGIQLDAIWTEGGGFDDSWDTVWHSRGELTDRGYVVWIAIPFRSLRFPPDVEQTWGIVLVRDVQRTDEETFWPPVTTRIEGRLNQAGTLDGLIGISGGSNTQIIPYTTARSFEAIETSGEPSRTRDSFDPDAGVDAKIVFDDRLALDLTANPDFSQVESDLPQVTVNQRFEVFFPEKRPFFLENANYFQMPINLLFTRRIADPRGGARLTGKIGKYVLAAMVIDDESPGETALFNVLRARRDLGRQSSVGVFYSDRELAGDHNRVISADGRIKLTDNWVTQLQAVSSRTAGGTLTDEAYNVQFDRSGRHYGAHIHYVEVGPDFRTQTGFINRTDIRNLHTQQSYTFWPEGKRLLSWRPSLFGQYLEDHDGVRVDTLFGPSLEFEYRRSTEFEVTARHGEQTLRPQDLPPGSNQTLDFNVSEYSLRFDTRFISALDVNGNLSIGEGINFVPASGNLPAAIDTTFGRLAATVRPSTPTKLTFSYLGTRLTDRASGRGVLSNRIGRVRLDVQLSPRWSLRTIAEYETTDINPSLTRLTQHRRLNGDLLATYLVNPWTALYVGYNSNFLNRDLLLDPLGNQLVNTGTDLNKDAEQVFVKFSYLFQL